MKMQPLFLDLCPAYIPFIVQCTKADGDKADPSADNLIIYEEGGADGTFDAATITGSPFNPAQVNSKTGLWGVLVDKTVFTAGKVYIALWEMTVDSKTTAKVEVYHAVNASSFKADVSAILADTNELQGLISGSKLPAQIKGIDDIDFSATMKASVNSEVDSALNTAIPGSPTADSINERIKQLDTDVVAIKGTSFDSATDSLEAIRDTVDEVQTTTNQVFTPPTVEQITVALEAEGGILNALMFDISTKLDAKVSSRATLESGDVSVNFSVTVSSLPVPGAEVTVRAMNDTSAPVIVAGITNDAGVLAMSLQDGVTYYAWARKAGHTFDNPYVITVTA